MINTKSKVITPNTSDNSDTSYIPEEKKYVFAFDKGSKNQKDLGGKGANLAEMINLGIPIPQGFTITTDACKEYMHNENIIQSVMQETMNEMKSLEEITEKTYGGLDPLLVSVRSGAAVSMPGMMDTLLNIGLNDETVKALATKTNDEKFAYSCYHRLICTYADIIFGIPQKKSNAYLKKIHKNLKSSSIDTNISSYILKHYATEVKNDILKKALKSINESFSPELDYSEHPYVKMAPTAPSYKSADHSYGRIINTKGKKFEVEWSDGSFSLLYPKDLYLLTPGTEIIMNAKADYYYGLTKKGVRGTIKSDKIDCGNFVVCYPKFGNCTVHIKTFDVVNPVHSQLPKSSSSTSSKEYTQLIKRIESLAKKESSLDSFIDEISIILNKGTSKEKLISKESDIKKYARKGMKVIYTYNNYGTGPSKGLHGIIRLLRRGNGPGVEWEKNMGGHDLDGACEYGYGWWTDYNQLNLIVKQDLDITTLKSDTIRTLKSDAIGKISRQLLKKNNPILETMLLQNYIKKTCGKSFPQDVHIQLESAIKAVFESWNSDRAKEYRNIYGISDSIGTAVNVQTMVFGNFNEKSGTGVCFSRNPNTGIPELYGEYLSCAQGEDIVAGIRTPVPISKLKQLNPKLYTQLELYAKKLEEHYKDMQDIEFTIENDKLYLLQTRSGKRSAAAQVKIAVDLAKAGIITKENALTRIDPNTIDKLFQEHIEHNQQYTVLAKGIPATSGIVSGVIALSSDAAKRYAAKKFDVILVREETTPDDISGINISRGILTKVGGSTSHAAVVARGLNKICITGCNELDFSYISSKYIVIGYKNYAEGQFITLNGTSGEIIKGSLNIVKEKHNPNLSELMLWTKQLTGKEYSIIADTPNEIRDIDGPIGLMRTDHHFFLNDALSLTRKYLSHKGNSRINKNYALNSLQRMQEQFYEQTWNVLSYNTSIRIQLLNVPLQSFIPTLEELALFGEASSKSSKYSNKYIKPAAWDVAMVYEMQMKAIMNTVKNSTASNIDIVVPHALLGKMYNKCVYSLEKLARKDSRIRINNSKEPIYIINSSKPLDIARANAANIIVGKPQHLEQSAIKIAQSYLSASNNPSNNILNHTNTLENISNNRQNNASDTKLDNVLDNKSDNTSYILKLGNIPYISTGE